MAVNIFKKPGRQTVLVAEAVLTYANTLSPADLNAVDTPCIDMPEGAMVVGGRVFVVTAFNSATSDTLDVGDNDDPNRYTNGGAVDISTADVFPLTLDTVSVSNHVYTAGETINFTWTAVGADATAGEVRIQIHYIIADRANETQSLKVTNYGAARQ